MGRGRRFALVVGLAATGCRIEERCREPTPAAAQTGWDEFRWKARPEPLAAGVALRIDQRAPAGCPAYTVTVHDDGRVEYVGRTGVTVRGRRAGRMRSRDEVPLVRALSSLRTHESRDVVFVTHHGWDTARCAFERVFQFRIDGRAHVFSHRIEDDERAPECLRHLEYRIVQLTGVLRWTGGDPLGDSALQEPLH